MTEKLIRPIFDQYEQLENRLTNALVQLFARDQRITRDFVRFSTGAKAPAREKLSLSCQRLPGESAISSDDSEERAAEARGIPDAWIYTDSWALIIEAKVTAGLTTKQLRAHAVTAQDRGFHNYNLLVISADDSPPPALSRLPAAVRERTSWRSWPDVYRYLSGQRPSNPVSAILLQELLDYMRVLEARIMATEKALTSFAGIPFGGDHPYSELEARVLLRSLMRELRPKLARSRILPVARQHKPKHLTGTWDVVQLELGSAQDNFVLHPHLSVYMAESYSSISIVLPDAAKSVYWNRLNACDEKRLRDVLTEVDRNFRSLRRAVGNTNEPILRLSILQRHFPSRRGDPVEDALLSFDVDTQRGTGQKPISAVKAVSAWLDAFYAVIANRREANFQLELEARYPMVEGSASRGPGFVDALVASAEGFQPFLELLLRD